MTELAQAVIADAAILTDNSRTLKEAFTVCRIQLGRRKVYDCRDKRAVAPLAIQKWLDTVCPIQA